MTTPEPSPAATLGKGCLYLVLAGTGLVVIFAILLWNSVSDSTDTDEPTVAEQVTVVCQDAVKDRLKSPSTAKFSNVAVLSNETPSEGVQVITINGAVDSENGFGATLRTNWVCEARVVDGTATTTVRFLE